MAVGPVEISSSPCSEPRTVGKAIRGCRENGPVCGLLLVSLSQIVDLCFQLVDGFPYLSGCFATEFLRLVGRLVELFSHPVDGTIDSLESVFLLVGHTESPIALRVLNPATRYASIPSP